MKNILKRNFPKAAQLISTFRNRLYFRKRFSGFQTAAKKTLYGEGGEVRVLTGPFAGMCYLDAIVWGSITPKWLGSYEWELAPVWEAVSNRDYDVVIDVGCAEGYYAVGLCVMLKNARVHAYDTDFISRSQARRLGRLNGISDRLHIGGFCTHKELAKRAEGRTLLICDIEGWERDFLNPERCGKFAEMDILVEVHEARRNATDMLDLLKDRFGDTHEIEELAHVGSQEWLEKNKLPHEQSFLLEACKEHRNQSQKWLWMVSRKR